jgi:hypothetical protein
VTVELPPEPPEPPTIEVIPALLEPACAPVVPAKPPEPMFGEPEPPPVSSPAGVEQAPSPQAIATPAPNDA